MTARIWSVVYGRVKTMVCGVMWWGIGVCVLCGLSNFILAGKGTLAKKMSLDDASISKNIDVYVPTFSDSLEMAKKVTIVPAMVYRLQILSMKLQLLSKSCNRKVILMFRFSFILLRGVFQGNGMCCWRKLACLRICFIKWERFIIR